jgi:hypothetical protein
LSAVATSVSPIFGRILSAAQIEDAVLAVMEAWFPTYLAEMERQEGMRVGTLVPPDNYINRNSFETLEGEKMPKVVVMAEGLTGTPSTSGMHIYKATWNVGVGIATAAKTEEVCNRMVKAYGAAVRALVLNKMGTQNIIGVANVNWTQERYPSITIPSPIQLFKAANISFAIDVEDVAHKYGGPATPSRAVPAPWTDVQTVDTELDIVPEDTEFPTS